MTQLAEMRAAARRFFLKSSIPENHKREQSPSERTTPVKTNPGPNRKQKTPIMSLEGVWVWMAVRIRVKMTQRNFLA